MSNLEQLKTQGEAPFWMGEEGFLTLSRGYLQEDETPRDMYLRVACAAGSYFPGEHWEDAFFAAMWKNWLCPASPILANMGTDRGLPVSCNTIHVDDSVHSIFNKNYELAVLSKHGAGVGIYLGDVRGRGSVIKGNGKSEGIIPWAKVYDTTISSVSQGATRRGAAAVYLPIDHVDIEEFINLRRPTGDANRRCLNLNHGVCISDAWMESMLAGDAHKRKLWEELLYARATTGEPYILFIDNVNKQNPACYVKHGLQVKSSNICTEIMLHTDPKHSFVCDLSSLNLTTYEEWKDTSLVETTVYFLDAVMSEYLKKTKDLAGFEAAYNHASKGRAIGIGVLGWHTLLQQKNVAFDSFDAMRLNAEIFKGIRDKSEAATSQMAKEWGEPAWCRGFNRRHTHLMAVAPTVSNSAISGGYSAGIEPIAGNVQVVKSAKGTFIRQNKVLASVLKTLGKDTPETWKAVVEAEGSVQQFDWLSDHLKEVFLTARELNQHAIIRQAAQRQRFIDQGQSINLFFAGNSSPKYIHEVHIEAWKQGVKSLYYLRTDGVLRGDLASRSATECSACEG